METRNNKKHKRFCFKHVFNEFLINSELLNQYKTVLVIFVVVVVVVCMLFLYNYLVASLSSARTISL